jgi:hypothetical protein
MSLSRKYGANGKTFHVPWSEGTDSTDRKNWDYWTDIQQGIKELVFTSKLDGEGTCLNEFGVFARSHAAPSDKPWSAYLRQKHAVMVHDLKKDQVEIFGENLYALHSIEYPCLDEYFHVFAVRHLDQWLSWEEVEWWSSVFDLKTVPVLGRLSVDGLAESFLVQYVKELGAQPELFGSYDIIDNKPCSREGIVFRNVDGFHVDAFVQNIMKMVRKGHVKTDEHWERHWKRAYLKREVKAYADSNGIPLSDAASYWNAINTMRVKR